MADIVVSGRFFSEYNCGKIQQEERKGGQNGTQLAQGPHCLRRRSQKTRLNWERMGRLLRKYLPRGILHPIPSSHWPS